jgi:hypothetical protein
MGIIPFVTELKMLNNKNNSRRKHPTDGNQSNRMKLYHVDNTFMHFFKNLNYQNDVKGQL